MPRATKVSGRVVEIDVEAVGTAGAAAFLDLSPAYLKNLRRKGKGPRYFKRGRMAMYRIVDLREWLYASPFIETIDSRKIAEQKALQQKVALTAGSAR